MTYSSHSRSQKMIRRSMIRLKKNSTRISLRRKIRYMSERSSTRGNKKKENQLKCLSLHYTNWPKNASTAHYEKK